MEQNLRDMGYARYVVDVMPGSGQETLHTYESSEDILVFTMKGKLVLQHGWAKDDPRRAWA